MPSTRIALRPRPRPLAAVGRRDVEAAQLLHALEPVADRVAVGEELRGRLRDVAVGLEERLEREHEVGVVLLVVGDQRRDRLVVEALQLGRVLAHRGQQDPVRARLLEREQSACPGPRPRSRRAEPPRRRGGCPPGRAAGRLMRDGEVVRRRDSRRARAARPRATRRACSASAPGTTITISPSWLPGRGRPPPRAQSTAAASTFPCTGRARRARRSRALARASRPPRAPAGARAPRRRSRRPRGRCPARCPRATMFSRSVTLRSSRSRRKPATAASLARSGAARALDLEPDQRADVSDERGRRHLAAARGSAARRPSRRPPAAPCTSSLRRAPRARRPATRTRPRAMLPDASTHNDARARAPGPSRVRPRAARRRTRPPPRRRANASRNALRCWGFYAAQGVVAIDTV